VCVCVCMCVCVGVCVCVCVCSNEFFYFVFEENKNANASASKMSTIKQLRSDFSSFFFLKYTIPSIDSFFSICPPFSPQLQRSPESAVVSPESGE